MRALQSCVLAENAVGPVLFEHLPRAFRHTTRTEGALVRELSLEATQGGSTASCSLMKSIESRLVDLSVPRPVHKAHVRLRAFPPDARGLSRDDLRATPPRLPCRSRQVGSPGRWLETGRDRASVCRYREWRVARRTGEELVLPRSGASTARFIDEPLFRGLLRESKRPVVMAGLCGLEIRCKLHFYGFIVVLE